MSKHLYLVIFSIILLIGCNNYSYNNYENSELRMYHTYEEFQIIFGNSTGIELGTQNRNHLPDNRLLVMNQWEDELVTHFSNFMGNEFEFIMKVFIDYESVNFTICGYESNNYFIFNLKHNERQTINFSIEEYFKNLEQSFHYLTVMVLLSPNSFQADVQLYEHKFYGTIVTKYLFVGYFPEFTGRYETMNEEQFLGMLNLWTDNRKFKNIDYTLSLDFHYSNFNVNLHNQEYWETPPYYIIVSPNEEISFRYTLGDFTSSHSEEFVVFALLDWQQININNQNKINVFLNSNEDGVPQAQEGVINFTSPSKLGRYEFLAFAGQIRREATIFPFLTENSFRITIIVE